MNEFIDVNYTEENIAGPDNVTYNVREFSRLLGIKDSTVRYYLQQFQDHLAIEIKNGNKRFTKESIVRFKEIRKLKEERNLTIKQIHEYLEKNDLTKSELVATDDNDNESAVNIVKCAVSEVMNERLAQFSNEMEKKITDVLGQFLASQLDMNEQLINNINTSIENIIDNQSLAAEEKLKENMKMINENTKHLEELLKSNNAQQDILKVLDEIKYLNEKVGILNEVQQANAQNIANLNANQKKGFLKKLFSK